MKGFLALGASVCALALALAQNAPQKGRNAIIFVADGLRAGSVNPIDTPALWSVRASGVYFANSHSLFPTLTMVNGASLATGHYPGDTGQFGNFLFVGYPIYYRGNFGRMPGTLTPDTEDPQVLGDISDHFAGNYLREASLLAFARSYGYNTASIGKRGPAGLQDLTELTPSRRAFRTEPTTIIIESDAGTERAFPMSIQTAALLKAAGMTPAPPGRRQSEGNNVTPGTLETNAAQQQWFADAITKAILPRFRASEEPFVLVFWSGDPDITQHTQGDSLNTLAPGINGSTSLAAIRHADRNLKQILDYLASIPELAESTNVFVTADHGFATVSRREVDAHGHPTKSYAATVTYRDIDGRQEVNDGFLPNGFVAIDLARALGLPLYDPADQIADAAGVPRYIPVDPATARTTPLVRQRPAGANALIGGTGRVGRPTDAKVVVVGNAVYVPGNDRSLVERIVRFLATQDYVGGMFVNDRLGQFDGALPMSAVALMGSTTLPRPAVMVNFKTFATDAKNALMTGVIVGSTLQHGQGSHGSLSRAITFNNMAAMGPDFKKGFVSDAPVSNADIVPTLAQILKMKIPSRGNLKGRAIAEALIGGPAKASFTRKIARSKPAASGQATVLMYQQAGQQLYFDEACFTNTSTCEP